MNNMTLNNTSKTEIIDHRRRLVAAYRLRGYTQREIVRMLAEEEEINPKTGKSWSLGIVNADIRFLREQWKAQAAQDTETHKSKMLAELREVVRVAWESDDLGVILRSLKQQAELLGLDEPQETKNDFTIKVEYGDGPNSQPSQTSP
jgi:hypothetical protein